MNFDVQYLVGFKHSVGEEVTFYCSRGVLRGTIVEQSNYIDKDNMTVIGYAIKSNGETYFHIPEDNVFPRSMETGVVLQIIQYRVVHNEYNRIIRKKEILEEKMDELRAGIPKEYHFWLEEK